MDKRIIPAIVSVMVLLVVGLAVLAFFALRPQSLGSNSDFVTAEGPAVDSGARIEIELLRSQIDGMAEQIKALDKRIDTVVSNAQAATSTAPVEGDPAVAEFVTDGPNQIIDSYAQTVLIANRRQLNNGVRIASPTYLESVLGRPREVLSNNCEAMTNQRLASKLVTAQVGPIRVRMLQPAIDSLTRVFEKIRETDPDLYERINTAGALCVRQIRGTNQRTSTHSFGLSVDLNIDGKLDTLGDGKTQLGLTILADFFQEEGWYWGAGFTREDSMHFEVSRDMVEKWIAEGKL